MTTTFQCGKGRDAVRERHGGICRGAPAIGQISCLFRVKGHDEFWMCLPELFNLITIKKLRLDEVPTDDDRRLQNWSTDGLEPPEKKAPTPSQRNKEQKEKKKRLEDAKKAKNQAPDESPAKKKKKRKERPRQKNLEEPEQSEVESEAEDDAFWTAEEISQESRRHPEVLLSSWLRVVETQADAASAVNAAVLPTQECMNVLQSTQRWVLMNYALLSAQQKALDSSERIELERHDPQSTLLNLQKIRWEESSTELGCSPAEEQLELSSSGNSVTLQEGQDWSGNDAALQKASTLDVDMMLRDLGKATLEVVEKVAERGDSEEWPVAPLPSDLPRSQVKGKMMEHPDFPGLCNFWSAEDQVEQDETDPLLVLETRGQNPAVTGARSRQRAIEKLLEKERKRDARDQVFERSREKNDEVVARRLEKELNSSGASESDFQGETGGEKPAAAPSLKPRPKLGEATSSSASEGSDQEGEASKKQPGAAPAKAGRQLESDASSGAGEDGGQEDEANKKRSADAQEGKSKKRKIPAKGRVTPSARSEGVESGRKRKKQGAPEPAASKAPGEGSPLQESPAPASSPRRASARAQSKSKKSFGQARSVNCLDGCACGVFPLASIVALSRLSKKI